MNFKDINSRRQVGFSGYQPITFTEINAWRELMNKNLSEFDVRAIIRLDAAFMRVSNE